MVKLNLANWWLSCLGNSHWLLVTALDHLLQSKEKDYFRFFDLLWKSIFQSDAITNERQDGCNHSFFSTFQFKQKTTSHIYHCDTGGGFRSPDLGQISWPNAFGTTRLAHSDWFGQFGDLVRQGVESFNLKLLRIGCKSCSLESRLERCSQAIYKKLSYEINETNWHC